MRWLVAALCVLFAFGCERQKAADESSPMKPSNAPPGMVPIRVGSAAFHFEMGGVYERFQDPKTAIEHFAKAGSLGEDPAQRVQAYSALARVKQAAGDRRGAIEALETARSVLDGKKAPGAQGEKPAVGPPHPILPGAGEDVTFQLATLYAEEGQHDKARAECDRGLSAARDPWQRERFGRLQVELDRKAGKLAGKLAEMEKALDALEPDESALRFLVLALGARGMQGPPPAGGPPPARPRSDPSKLIRAYERLYALHPEEPGLRENLLSLLERSGRIDEAVKLIRAAQTSSPMDCGTAQAAQLGSPALQREAAVVRIRQRAGQAEESLAEIAKIEALAKREGIAAYLLASDLYFERGATGRATELLDRARREAHSQGDQRLVAFARERGAMRGGRSDDLKAIYAEWKKSDDPCLRSTAEERAQMQAMAAATPLPRPPPQ